MRKYYGKYLGICRDNHDPKMVGRIRVEVPYVFGTGEENWSTWALPCLPPGHFHVPEEGDGVWVEFLGGDPGQPIWSGIWYRGRGETTTAPYQAVHEALTDLDGNDVETDREHAVPGSVDHAEHTEYHDHVSGFYTPHRFGFFSHTGHGIEWNDHPGTKGYVRIAERLGRLIEMTAEGMTRLRSRILRKNEIEGLDEDRAHELVLSDDPNDPFVRLEDLWGQGLRIISKPGEEALELVDKAGQKIRLDVSTGTVKVHDKSGNTVELKDRKVTIDSVGDVIVNVPDGGSVHIGGEGGKELATRDFVEKQFNTHTHVSGAPGSPTSPPMSPSPLVPGNDLTRKQKSE